MITTGKTNLHEIEKQLNPLYYEVSLLRFRVGEARPEVRTQYRDMVSNLSAQYHYLEMEVKDLKEAEKGLQEERLTVAEQNLQELQEKLDTVGQWIYIETANQVCTYF
jgi:chromosome segregation ATPase